MKRKLLAIIVLIVLAFGVMAFAACDDSDTLRINSYDKGGDPSSGVIMSVEMQKEFSVDEPYKIKVEYGTTSSVRNDEESPVGYLKIYDPDKDVRISVEGLVAMETLLEIPSLFSKSNRLSYEYKNGKECGYIFNASVEVEIPKKFVSGSSGRIALLLVDIYLPEDGDYTNGQFMGSGVVISYKVKSGKIYFSKG